MDTEKADLALEMSISSFRVSLGHAGKEKWPILATRLLREVLAVGMPNPLREAIWGALSQFKDPSEVVSYTGEVFVTTDGFVVDLPKWAEPTIRGRAICQEYAICTDLDMHERGLEAFDTVYGRSKLDAIDIWIMAVLENYGGTKKVFIRSDPLSDVFKIYSVTWDHWRHGKQEYLKSWYTVRDMGEGTYESECCEDDPQGEEEDGGTLVLEFDKVDSGVKTKTSDAPIAKQDKVDK